MRGAPRAGAEFHVELYNLQTTDLSIEIRAESAGIIVRLPEEKGPTGVYAANDSLAMGLIGRLTLELGV